MFLYFLYKKIIFIMNKIVIDVYGGDYSPQETVKGVVEAYREESDFLPVLSGKREEILSLLPEEYKKTFIVVDAPDVITNDDVPTEAVRRKKESSLVKAFYYMNENDDCKAFVSSGSTGAVLTAAILLTKRIKGIVRPALAPVLPTIAGDKKTILIDCGANAEPKAQNIVQFAQMGIAYAKTLGVNNPVVGLLNNGAEAKKGNALCKEAHDLLAASGLSFYGNIEGRDILSGIVDVVVCDGFSGNIALKSCEGTAVAVFSLLKEGILQGGLRAKLGYLLLKPVLKQIKIKMDYNDNGGAVLLGLEKVIVKAHGSSKAKAVKNTVLQAKHLAETGITEKISEALDCE